MFRILLIIALILLSIPFFNKARDYAKEKIKKVEAVGEVVVDSAKKIRQYKK